ncbi:MAG: DNA polymerase IV [Pseudomonadota bacterium]
MSTPALCRACFTSFSAPATGAPCPACASRDTIVHAELRDLTLAHMDCDAFYAAVEKRDNPALRDVALIVGGGQRGVVTTACYIARLSGVHSAMPMFKARRLCPQAVVVKPRMRRYKKVSLAIRELMLSVTPQIEPISVDEAFLDLAGTERLHGEPPAAVLAKLAARVEKEIGITVSIGLSHNKFLAKLASDYDKPRGFFVIGKAETQPFLAPQPVKKLWGVGKAFEAKLARDGITHVGQIQNMEEEQLIASYGSMGRHIWRLANGLDSRPVKTERRAKSISSERTFATDISDYETLSDLLWTLSEEIARQLSSKQFSARTVQLKLKTPAFKLITRSTTPGPNIQSPTAIFNAADALLQREANGQPYRLLGVGVSNLGETAQDDTGIDLFAASGDTRQDQPAVDAKTQKIEGVMAGIRGRYGQSSIETGRGLRARQKGVNRRQSLSQTQKPDAPDETGL